MHDIGIISHGKAFGGVPLANIQMCFSPGKKPRRNILQYRGRGTKRTGITIAIRSSGCLRDKSFTPYTALFIVLSIASVYIGSSTKNAEMSAYNNVINLLKAQGSSNLPASPDIYPLAILKNIVTYVSMIGSVLAIFLGFDAFSGERENGSIKLVLTRPVYRDQLITGKLIGGGMVIGLLLIVTLIVNILLFTAVSGIFPNANEIGRLVMFILIAFLYMKVILTITLFVSIKTGDRTFGFLTMMIIWLFIGFVIPQLAETQRSFAMSLNSTSQTVATVATDTVASRIIEYFSPTAQFESIGENLLQTVSDTAGISVMSVILKRAIAVVCMLVPGIVFLLASYRAVQNEEL
jgi:ABC-2 type transport system permease protein